MIFIQKGQKASQVYIHNGSDEERPENEKKVVVIAVAAWGSSTIEFSKEQAQELVQKLNRVIEEM
ncbi:hypothetical protein [Larkinella harenae]